MLAEKWSNLHQRMTTEHVILKQKCASPSLHMTMAKLNLESPLIVVTMELQHYNPTVFIAMLVEGL